MTDKFDDDDWHFLHEWLEDQTFLAWAKQTDSKYEAKWESYLNLNPHHWELAKVGREIVLGVPFKEIPRNSGKGQEALAKLQQRIRGKNEKAGNQTVSMVRRRSWFVAASLALFVLTSCGLYWQFFYNPRIFLVTDFGQQKEFLLPDGSTVILNANSELRYNRQDPRMVWLDGEAYFKISKKLESGAQFQVITQDLAVNVLGTIFNVNSRNDETEVFLEEGKVMLDIVDPNREAIEMNPGDLVTYSKGRKDLREKRGEISALEAVSWKEGSLVFRKRPLLDALFEIEDIYGIQFIVQTDDLDAEIISGGVPISDLQVTLTTLTEIYGIQMRSAGRRYFITGRNN